MSFPKINFSSIIKQKIPGLKLGLVLAESVNVLSSSEIADIEIKDLSEFIKDKFCSDAPSTDETVSAVRRMYYRIGWEPTRYRPSSEAMIRRFIKDKGLYRINNFVDLGNVVSTRFHLPMGLYDLDKIEEGILLDVGQEGESYQGISKELIHATGKMVLRDNQGIFGNPTADSLRTCIETNTENILAIFFTPPDLRITLIEETLLSFSDLYKKECPRARMETKTVTCD